MPFVAQAYNRSTSGFNPSYSAGGFGNQAAQDDAASSVLDDDGFSPSGPGVDWALDDTSYPDPTARDANDYLQEFAPRLYYDTVEPYRATAIETITDNYDEDEGAFTNMLVDGSDAPMAWSDPSEQAGNSNDLALGFLGLIYPNLSVAESEDNLVEAEYGSTLGGSNAGKSPTPGVSTRNLALETRRMGSFMTTRATTRIYFSIGFGTTTTRSSTSQPASTKVTGSRSRSL